MKKQIVLILLLASGYLLGQPAENLADKYVVAAFKNNLMLRQKSLSLQESVAALSEARGLFLPAVNLEARYSRAGGGRTIDFPIGQIINPIYQSLNALLGATAFSQPLEDQQIAFMRRREHDTRIRLTQPIFNSDIYQNYHIRKQQSKAQRAATLAFARHLAAEVKSAYFAHATSIAMADLMANTESLVQENLRVSASLFENQKVTREAVYRAQAELSKIRQNLQEAQMNVALTRSAFNFLLNRPLDSSVEVAVNPHNAQITPPLLTDAIGRALDAREEFRQLTAAQKAATHSVALEKGKFLPSLSLVGDFGYQGEEYRFGKEDDYWMASLVLQWNLFNGGQDKARIQQSKLAVTRLQMENLLLEERIRISVQQAHLSLQVAVTGVRAAEEQLTASRKAFQIVESKYRAGLTTQIDYLDARNRLTTAEAGRIAALNLLGQRHAEFEKEAALLDVASLLPEDLIH